jgi:hypothetical protein
MVACADFLEVETQRCLVIDLSNVLAPLLLEMRNSSFKKLTPLIFRKGFHSFRISRAGEGRRFKNDWENCMPAL